MILQFLPGYVYVEIVTTSEILLHMHQALNTLSYPYYY